MSRATLRDGTQVEIRPVQDADSADVADVFDRMSTESRYRRFLTPTPRITSTQLDYLTHVDHRDHEFLVAGDPATGKGLGGARFVRSREIPTEAEFAVSVTDDWQGRGLGNVLLCRLVQRAREVGVEWFTGLVLSDNHAMLHVLNSLGEVETRHGEGGTVEVRLALPTVDAGDDGHPCISGWMRAAATGELGSRL